VRSLAYQATRSKVYYAWKSKPGHIQEYQKITFWGHLKSIPVLLSRKMAPPRIKSTNVTQFSIIPKEVGEYCGVEVSGNGRYLVEDFWVTHNSTLTTSLSEKLNATPIFEPVEDNPYLSLFYNDMHKYGFPMQIFLLNRRFVLHRKAHNLQTTVILDRTLSEDKIFAKMLRDSGHMTAMDFDTYRELFINMKSSLQSPDLIVYLDVEPEVALERVRRRSRGCESKMSVEYLRALRAGYEDWLLDIAPQIPVLKLDWNEFQDVDKVIEKMNHVLKARRKTAIHV
jgi:deoxyadenosine/deoxycytidine kinase